MSVPFPPLSGPVPEPGSGAEPSGPMPLPPEPPFPAITLGTAHCCPYCGGPIAVVSLLMPVEVPPPVGA